MRLKLFKQRKVLFLIFGLIVIAIAAIALIKNSSRESDPPDTMYQVLEGKVADVSDQSAFDGGVHFTLEGYPKDSIMLCGVGYLGTTEKCPREQHRPSKGEKVEVKLKKVDFGGELNLTLSDCVECYVKKL